MDTGIWIDIKWPIKYSGEDSDVAVIVITADGNGFQSRATIFDEMGWKIEIFRLSSGEISVNLRILFSYQ